MKEIYIYIYKIYFDRNRDINEIRNISANRKERNLTLPKFYII